MRDPFSEPRLLDSKFQLKWLGLHSEANCLDLCHARCWSEASLAAHIGPLRQTPLFTYVPIVAEVHVCTCYIPFIRFLEYLYCALPIASHGSQQPTHANVTTIMSSYEVYSRSRIEGLIAAGSTIVISRGRVLQLDVWLNDHPGGRLAIQHMVGRDATDEISM